MARTNIERYNQALDYINKNISRDLGNSIARHAAGSHEKLGKAISLSSAGFWKTGTDGQHMAIRALLLCQQVFLKPPFMQSDLAGDGSDTKRRTKNCNEMQVRQMIECYTRSSTVSLHTLAQAARDVSDLTGNFNNTLLTRTRAESGNWGGTSNCYSAVKIWLFKSGLCSLQWLLKDGSEINAYTVNTILGDGEVVREDNLNSIPEGWIFNIHDADDPNICHWGIALGGGRAAASNTSGGGPRKNGEGKVESVLVKFHSGSSPYGIFDLASSVEVCKCNYKSGRVVIKKTNPATRTNYY